MPAEKKENQVVAAQTDDNDDGVRLYNEEKDAKVSKMLVGQGVMEGLARANRKSQSSGLVHLLETSLD